MARLLLKWSANLGLSFKKLCSSILAIGHLAHIKEGVISKNQGHGSMVELLKPNKSIKIISSKTYPLFSKEIEYI